MKSKFISFLKSVPKLTWALLLFALGALVALGRGIGGLGAKKLKRAETERERAEGAADVLTEQADAITPEVEAIAHEEETIRVHVRELPEQDLASEFIQVREERAHGK